MTIITISREADSQVFPPCKGMNCGCTDGRSHSLECQAEHAAAIAGGRVVKDEPQAQAVEPEVVAQIVRNQAGQVRITDANGVAFDVSKHIGESFITLQSHREAMTAVLRHKEDWKSSCVSLQKQRNALQEDLAKKDAALKACVTAIQNYRKPMRLRTAQEEDAAGEALAKAQEALK